MALFKISGLCLASVLLAACHSNSDNNQHSTPTMNDLTTLGNVTADGDPVQVLDPAGLQQDIISLFGNADDDPLAVEENDTLQTIIDRGGRA